MSALCGMYVMTVAEGALARAARQAVSIKARQQGWRSKHNGRVDQMFDRSAGVVGDWNVGCGLAWVGLVGGGRNNNNGMEWCEGKLGFAALSPLSSLVGGCVSVLCSL